MTSARGINRGVIPDLSRPDGDSDFYFVAAEGPETAAARIVNLVMTRIPKRFGFNPVRDIQVLCPMNRGGAGARSLNARHSGFWAADATASAVGARKHRLSGDPDQLAGLRYLTWL